MRLLQMGGRYYRGKRLVSSLFCLVNDCDYDDKPALHYYYRPLSAHSYNHHRIRDLLRDKLLHLRNDSAN